MSADDVRISPERGTSRVLYWRTGAKAPPGDWDAGWPSLALPASVKFNAAGWCVFDGDAASRDWTRRARGAQRSIQA